MSTKLSATKQLAIQTLDFIKERIIKGDCSEEEIADSMSRVNLDAHKEYINTNDYINVDQAMKLLGVGRQRFFKLTKEYGIINHTFNNQHIGFLRKEIEELAWKLKNN